MVFTPPEGPWKQSERSMNSDTVWRSLDGEETRAFCLGCPDSPCTRFTNEEIKSVELQKIPLDPNVSVCPSNAISQEKASAPQLNSELCTSCGICIVRCPVGALHLGSSGVEISECNFDPTPYEETQFLKRRSLIGESLRFTSPPDENSLIQRLEKIENYLDTVPESDSVLRMLVRNLLIVMGLSAQLSRKGDNYSITECMVKLDNLTMLFQIEHKDLLDSLRRSISSVAVSHSRYALPMSELLAGVITVRLPNKRVDYYEVITDVEKQLNIKIRTLPLAILLAAIGNSNLNFVELVTSGATKDTLSKDLEKLIGPIENPERLGVVPAK